MSAIGETKTIPGRGEQTVVPLLHHLASSQSQRVLYMLEELNEVYGLEYQLRLYNRIRPPQKSDICKVYPLGKSPVLQVMVNGKLSDKIYQLPQYPGTMAESVLIMGWLNETFAKGMYEPETEIYKARDIYFQNFALATMADKITFSLIFDMISMALPWGLRHLVTAMLSPVINFFKAEHPPVFQLMEDTLSDEAPWFAGSKVGLSDINMVWGMDMAWNRGYFDRKKYPKIARWYKSMVLRPAYKRALEKGGAYDMQTFKLDSRKHPAIDPDYKWD